MSDITKGQMVVLVDEHIRYLSGLEPRDLMVNGARALRLRIFQAILALIEATGPDRQKCGDKPLCIKCKGDVILQEDGGTLDAYGYGYGTFECQKCGHRSSYYGEGLTDRQDAPPEGEK